MTPEGIAQLQQAAVAAEIAAQAESAAVAAKETAQADIEIAKTSIDGVAATSATLIAELRALLEGTPYRGYCRTKNNRIRRRNCKAVASVADADNIGVEALESASNELKSAVTIIESVETFIPEVLKQTYKCL